MKRIISIVLSAVLLLTTVLTVPMVFAADTAVSITNTFDEAGWTPTDANLVLATPNGANGNALQYNNITSSSATTGNAIRHYKIFNPEKVDGGYLDFKPSANTTYKLTFRYRTRSLTSNNIFDNIMSPLIH